MCGVIVVDAGRSRSTCHGRDAYIHDHCLRYRHNFALFYQLLNSNLFTHRMRSFKREASSENYDPRVYSYHIIFSYIKQKTKIPCCNLFTLLILHFYLSFIPISIRSHPCNQVWRDCQPLFRVGWKYFCVCRCNYRGLACASYWIDTLVLN